jgi:hypothetical protein
MVRQRHVARHRHMAPADQPRIREGVVGRATRAGGDQRRTVPREARDAVDTRGLNPSARVIAGSMVVSRRASIDVPAPGGPKRSRLWSERLHPVQVHYRIGPERRLSP